MVDEQEVGLMVTREEAATVLRRVADGVIGGSVRVGEADEGVDVAIPEEFDLEVEFETEDGEESLEVELEWSTGENDSDGEADEAAEADAGDGSEESDEPASEASNEPADGARADVAEEPLTVPGLDESSASGARFEVFRDRADEWRWRLVHRNGNIIADSGEGYTRKRNARKGLQSVIRNAPSADIVDASDSRE